MSEKIFSVHSAGSSLPKEIALAYTVKKLIAIHRHNAVFTILSKASKKPYVLKILDKDYFDKGLYQKILEPPASYLLLPKLQISNHGFIYLVYPQLVPLPEAVTTNRLTYPMLRTLIADIGQAIVSLHEKEILHLDITPNNIFLGKDGHFYLGDFSSARFTGKWRFFHHSLRTGTTPAFAAPHAIQSASYSYWNDCYSFTLLLSYLFHYGQLPDENPKSILSPFTVLEPHFQKMLHEPPKAHKGMMKEFLSKLEDVLSLCDKDDACQSYSLQIQHPEQQSFFEATVHMEPEETKSSLFLLLRYGCLLLCGLLFLFALHHHLAKIRQPTEKSTAFVAKAQSRTSSPLVTVSETSAPPQTTDPLTPPPTVPFDTATETPPPSSEILFANHQKLTSCSSFAKQTELKELYLHDNKFASLQDFPKLPHLEVLVLSKNQITNVAPLAKLPALTILDLSHNGNLKNITSLVSLNNLQTLILTNTNIKKKEILSLQKKLPHCTIYY